MNKERFRELFIRYHSNPIIQKTDIPYQVNSVFNTAATLFKNETMLLMRVEDRRGFSHLTLARSKDGITDWEIEPQPTLEADPDNYIEEYWGIEDPRITYIDSYDLWAILYTSFSRGGPLVSLATTKDFKTFTRKGIIMLPENKDAALFPVQFNGRWAMIHRPVPGINAVRANMWISFSPDLKHWGDHKLLIQARDGGWWDANKIGISPPPLQTKDGWLILYHGVRQTAGGCIYRLGLALLDLKNPTQLIARSDEWVFEPETMYEMIGDVDKVVFPCGWVVKEDEVYLYYGSGDKCVSLAIAKVKELLDYLNKYKL